ncbi:MAG: isoprenylcysteine carboxylmethyltransferase family protein [Anaerolineales bacterium]|nr:isoprenylcysteine carboxylmethyltransferase family protein [Anaerolineales bacterium]MCB9144362.1 isoprenylcysteine carboxylmethyltransferase family protein [Anaerolineales bacterium]
MDEILFRISVAIVLFGSSAISIYYRRKANLDTGETVSTEEENKIVFLTIRLSALAAVLSMLTYLLSPSWMNWSKMGLLEPIRWVGVMIGFIFVGLCYWVFSSIGDSITTTVATRHEAKLITSGPYRWVRHPLYIVGLGTFGSIGVIADNWFIAGLIVLIFITLIIRTKDEEEHLIAKFGDEYREYMKRTGRFIPKFF